MLEIHKIKLFIFNLQIMPERELMPDKLTQLRADFESAFEKIDPPDFSRAITALNKYEGAVIFFELGLKLIREMPDGSEKLIEEIQDRLLSRKEQLTEQLFPEARK